MSSIVQKGTLRDYISIARPDHWGKNVFMLPGAALAFAIDKQASLADLINLLIGLIATCLIASANYTINEYLDGRFDRFHPTKSARPSAQGRLRPQLVAVQYVLLTAAGLGLASLLNPVFFYAALLLLVMGLIYNVEPVRSKDKAYVDVLTESFNNPIRLVLGWSAITTIVLPPSSMLIAYWMGGAYLMAIKRYAEYRMIGDPERAGRYRRSFAHYTEESLFLSAFFYALTSSFFLGIFLIKYKIEFLITFPFFALLFVWYQRIANAMDSPTMSPEKLYQQPRFMAYVIFLCLLVGVLFFVEVPPIQYLMDHSVIRDVRIQ